MKLPSTTVLLPPPSLTLFLLEGGKTQVCLVVGRSGGREELLISVEEESISGFLGIIPARTDGGRVEANRRQYKCMSTS